MIFISAGHSKNDPGAISNGHKEADLAIKLRDAVIKRIIELGGKHQSDDDKGNLNQTIINTRSNVGDIICDIHFNAATPQATGVEVFHPYRGSQEEMDLALKIAMSYSSIMGIKNRGIKDETQSQHKRLGIFKPNGTNILIEVCFITNPNDLKAFFDNFDKLAISLGDILVTVDKENEPNV